MGHTIGELDVAQVQRYSEDIEPEEAEN